MTVRRKITTNALDRAHTELNAAVERLNAPPECRMSWEFTEEGWFETIWGDVDRLPDGHVLITRAHCGTCQPASAARTQLVEVDPATNEVVWRLVMEAQDDAGYRAERVDGCAIFANARYCR